MKMNGWRGIALVLSCAALWPGIATAGLSPSFDSQPSDVLVTPGQDARFDAASTYDQSSQWQVSSDNGQTWTNLPGPYYTHLVMPAVTLADNGKQFRRRIFAWSEVVVSRAATLAVQANTSKRLDLLAGGLGGEGSPVDRLVGANLRFQEPGWLSADSAGNVYLGQLTTVLKIDSTRRAQTLAGHKNLWGTKDGKGAAAIFGDISGSVSAPNGDLYVVDNYSSTIRKIGVDGMTTTFAGSGNAGSADGQGKAASFNHPTGIARDAAGNFFVADTGNHTIRKITPAGVVSTWAGKAGIPGSGGTTVDDARFNGPRGVAMGPGDLLYVTDTDNHVIRRISPAGFVAKLAGEYGVPGSSNGVAGAAHFREPQGIAVNSNGDVFVADSANHTVRKLVGTTVTTLAGWPGSYGSIDGAASDARFQLPTGLALDRSGNLLVGDLRNHTIRKVNMTGVVTTWVGRPATFGSADGVGAEARFGGPQGLATDAAGNVYAADWGGASIRKVTSAGVVSTFSVGTGGTFQTPQGVAVDHSGNMFVTDSNACVIRRITPAGVASIIAGQPDDCRYVNGHGPNARFVAPSGITLDAQGNIFVTDGPLIRQITPSFDVSRYAGAYTTEPARDGTRNTARFSGPAGLAFDEAGTLFVADASAIRKITAAGVVTTLAGTLTDHSGLIDGPGHEARFMGLFGLTIDPAGNLYASDWNANAVRKITPAGTVTTLLGTHDMGTVVLGSNPLVNKPFGVAMIDANHLAISAENAILVYTLP